MERQEGHDGSAFPLMKLPRELRDHVYRLMVTPILSYHELACDPGGFFDRAILCTNRQVHTEASAAIAGTEIVILVDFRQLRSHEEYINLIDFTLLPFKRYSIEFNLTNRTTCAPGNYWEYQLQKEEMRRHIHVVAEALSNVAQLEQLHINCFKPESDSSQHDDTYLEQGRHRGPLPDNMMECFFQLRGLQNVVITGNLADAYKCRVTRSMKRPKLAPQVNPLNTKVQSSVASMPVHRRRGNTCDFGCSSLGIEDRDQLIPTSIFYGIPLST